ncbi:hypothetical protein HPP92_014811 [Vanilla planifolia]|uniref:ABC transporter domain-containing protein n=1 Tax=Vanilla planifolia TaxID=51239 RepID=A0A835QI11_VANPL|nr:hypothetical protein HPP92_014811 [Vanilla planifolia]
MLTFCNGLPRRTVCVLVVVFLLAAAQPRRGQDNDDYDYDDDNGDDSGSTADVPLFAEIVYERLMTLTTSFTKELGNELKFCIKNSDQDWNQAFNFSSDLAFLVNCINKKGGFIDNIHEDAGKTNILKPNKNCNLSSWVPGCEPGWACSIGPKQKVQLNDSKALLQEGFYISNNLTYMFIVMIYDMLLAGFYFDLMRPPGANVGSHLWGQQNHLRVALSLVLLIIYNFSGQLLSNRERRQAKSREAAARSARETVQARERWKSAKDVAKKHATELQAQLSRTFSRKTSKGLALSRGSNDESSSKNTGLPLKKKEPSNLTKMIRSLEENPESEEGFDLQIGDKNIKKNMPKGKQMHTRSQIFKYAYGQIEKEKALEQQNKNLTFSGIISMATDTDIRTRPVIEVAFKDLTLTLTGSKKRLLRSVTGKLMPGRVAAVMGPSGAGKTTFLSALAGKTTGCEVTGLVLINGKAESIRCYKKIIGFVPQDDIVHGNLTVEENLWFSARCRHLRCGNGCEDSCLKEELEREMWLCCRAATLMRINLVNAINHASLSNVQPSSTIPYMQANKIWEQTALTTSKFALNKEQEDPSLTRSGPWTVVQPKGRQCAPPLAMARKGDLDGASHLIDKSNKA